MDVCTSLTCLLGMHNIVTHDFVLLTQLHSENRTKNYNPALYKKVERIILVK